MPSLDRPRGRKAWDSTALYDTSIRVNFTSKSIIAALHPHLRSHGSHTCHKVGDGCEAVHLWWWRASAWQGCQRPQTSATTVFCHFPGFRKEYCGDGGRCSAPFSGERHQGPRQPWPAVTLCIQSSESGRRSPAARSTLSDARCCRSAPMRPGPFRFS